MAAAEPRPAGEVTPVIDRRYRLAEVPNAIRYLESGRAVGKVVIGVSHQPSDGPRPGRSA